MIKKIVKLLFPFIFVVCSISPSFSQNWGGNRASSVVVETPIQENLATTKEISAKVVSSISYTVSASSNGFVLMENIKVGDRIKKNQLIAIQDTSEFQYNLKIKQNQLIDAQLVLEDLKNELNEEKNIKEIIQKQLNILKSKYDRAKDLYESNAISAQELETSTTSYLTSQQQEFLKVKTIKKLNFKIKQAENNIEKLDIEINELNKDIKGSRLVSPIDGHLTEVFKIKNSYVRTGESLATIQGDEDFEIEVEVPTNYLKFIQEKKSINGLDVNGKNFKAFYRAILLNENPRTGTRTVRLSFKDKIRNVLRANNASVKILIPSSKPSSVITISKDAIIPISNGQMVFVMDEGKAVKTSVKFGGSIGERAIITDGLSVDDQVIIRGNELLKDGSSVKLAGKPSDKPKKEPEIKGDKWLLKWQGRNGERTGDLTVGKKVSFFNGEKVDLELKDNKLKFEAPLVLPFGTIMLNFEGKISSNKVDGTLTLKLPNGSESKVPFSGEKV